MCLSRDQNAQILRIKRGMEHAGQAKANLDEEIRKLSTRYNTFVNISLSKVLFVSNNAILIFRRYHRNGIKCPLLGTGLLSFT